LVHRRDRAWRAEARCSASRPRPQDTAERHWFQDVATGSAAPLPWPDDPGDEDAPFTTSRRRRSCSLSTATRSTAPTPSWPRPPLSAAPVGRHNREGADEVTDLRYIALHRIEETARHAGHLDAARELLGGRTGLRPPLAPASFPGPGGVSGAPSPDLRRRRPEDGSEAQNRRGRAQLQSWGEQGGADRGVQRARRGLGRGHDDPAGLHGVLADFTECLPTLRVACARLRLNRATRSFRFPLTGQCDSGVSWDHPAGRPLRDLTIGVAGATPIVRSRTRHRLGQRLVWLRGELVWLRRQVLLDDPRQRACRWWPRGGCSADSWVSRCPASDSPAEPLTGGRPSAEPRDAGRTGAMCTSRL